MRIYDNATIKQEHLSGFQSPCSEFAQKPLSFDEKFNVGNPGLRLLSVTSDFPALDIFKGDKLLVDLNHPPNPKSLIVTFLDDEIRLFKNKQGINLEDSFCAVVRVIVRVYESK